MFKEKSKTEKKEEKKGIRKNLLKAKVELFW